MTEATPHQRLTAAPRPEPAGTAAAQPRRRPPAGGTRASRLRVGALAFGALVPDAVAAAAIGVVQGLVPGGRASRSATASARSWPGWSGSSPGGPKPWTGHAAAWRALAVVGGRRDGRRAGLRQALPGRAHRPHGPARARSPTGTSAVLVVGALVGPAAARHLTSACDRLSHWVTRQVGRCVPARTARAHRRPRGHASSRSWSSTGSCSTAASPSWTPAFKTKNDTTTGGHRPTDVHRTSPAARTSQIPWDKLGRKGRDFIGGVTSTADLNALQRSGAIDPIRVYVGLESSSDAAEAGAARRATTSSPMGAFDRKVLAVGTTTGTGWVDENAVDPLEYMYNGDTAIVATQYSYLPSWLSFLVDKERAKEAGVTLFDAVYAEWSKRPGRRPAQAAGVRREPRLVRRRGGVQRTPRHRQPHQRRACSSARRTPTSCGGATPRIATPGRTRSARSSSQGQTLRWAQVPDDLTVPTAAPGPAPGCSTCRTPPTPSSGGRPSC